MIVSYVAGRNHERTHEKETDYRTVLYWVGPMYPDYKSDHPGKAQREYVERAKGVFESRRVQTGWCSGNRIDIVKRLTEGEQVMASGIFQFDSKSRLKPAQTTSKQERRTPRFRRKHCESRGTNGHSRHHRFLSMMSADINYLFQEFTTIRNCRQM